MKGFIQYIIENINDIKKSCKSKFIQYRNKANQDFAHGRIPEIIASEYFGLELFLEFANSNGVIKNEEMENFKELAWNSLISIAQKQSTKTEDNKPYNMFFKAIQEMWAAKKIAIKNYKNHLNEPDTPYTEFIGYYDRDKGRCYLFPQITYNTIVKFYAAQGIKFPGNLASTLKSIKEANKLICNEKDRNTVRKSVDGKMTTFIEVLAADVFGEEERKFGDYLYKFPDYPENHSKNLSIDELPF